MPLVTLSMGAVHYTACGDGPPLLLLHANPGDGRDFEAVIPALARDFRVLALDWPGFGQSPLPLHPDTVTVSQLTDVVREFLPALALPPAVIVGHSVGGNVAVRLASVIPDAVRALVLVAPGGFTPHGLVTRAFCRVQGSRFSLSPRLFAALYLRRHTPVTTAMRDRAAGEQAIAERVALSRALWRSFGRPESDVRSAARNVRAPTLLLFGRQDLVIPARRDGREAARCLPTARFAVLPGGHAPFAEVPERFLSELQPFLSALSTWP